MAQSPPTGGNSQSGVPRAAPAFEVPSGLLQKWNRCVSVRGDVITINMGGMWSEGALHGHLGSYWVGWIGGQLKGCLDENAFAGSPNLNVVRLYFEFFHASYSYDN